MKGENKGLKTAGLWIKIAGLDHSPCILLLESSTSSKIESIERFKLILCSEGLTELAPIQRLSAFDVEGLLRRSGPLTQSMASYSLLLDASAATTPAAAFATSSCAPGAWSILSRPPRAVRRSRQTKNHAGRPPWRAQSSPQAARAGRRRNGRASGWSAAAAFSQYVHRTGSPPAWSAARVVIRRKRGESVSASMLQMT
jgi:hypothetical protein